MKQAISELHDHYFGTGRENVAGSTCNVCGVDIGPWGRKKDLHIQFHEQLLARRGSSDLIASGLELASEQLARVPSGMTDNEFRAELAKAWQAGYDIGCDRTIDAAFNPYGETE